MENTEMTVTLTLPRARRGEPEELFVGINGVNYLVPRGQTVQVPESVAEELRRAQAAEEVRTAAAERLQERR